MLRKLEHFNGISIDSIKKQAERGYPDALYQLAVLKKLENKPQSEWKELLNKAAQEGFIEAKVDLLDEERAALGNVNTYPKVKNWLEAIDQIFALIEQDKHKDNDEVKSLLMFKINCFLLSLYQVEAKNNSIQLMKRLILFIIKLSESDKTDKCGYVKNYPLIPKVPHPNTEVLRLTLAVYMKYCGVIDDLNPNDHAYLNKSRNNAALKDYLQNTPVNTIITAFAGTNTAIVLPFLKIIKFLNKEGFLPDKAYLDVLTAIEAIKIPRAKLESLYWKKGKLLLSQMGNQEVIKYFETVSMKNKHYGNAREELGNYHFALISSADAQEERHQYAKQALAHYRNAFNFYKQKDESVAERLKPCIDSCEKILKDDNDFLDALLNSKAPSL